MFTHAGVTLRPVEERDLARMAELRAHPAIWKNLGTIEMISLDRQREWHRQVLNDRSRRYYVLCNRASDFLGIVRMDEIDHTNRSIRIGGDIVPRHQGKGYGQRMYRLLLKYCFDYLNMHRVWLLVLETNTVALRLYRKAGFVEEGRQRHAIFRDGRYVDYLMMSILHAQYERKGDR